MTTQANVKTETEEGVTVQKINAREKAYKRQRGLCYYCKRTVARSAATLDHRVPVCEGGNLQNGNAVMACYECNHKKGAMPESVFLQGEEAQREWKRRQGDLNRALNSDPSLALAYAELLGHVAVKARALRAVAEAKQRNREAQGIEARQGRNNEDWSGSREPGRQRRCAPTPFGHIERN